jgi:D-alanyl-D-alanine carboxypeptidase
MTKFLAVIFSIYFFSTTCARAEEGCSDVYSLAVFEEESGKIIFEKRAEIYAYPASLAKMMTLYLVFEALENKKLQPEQMLTVSDRGAEIAKVNKYSTTHLALGEQISVRDLIRAVIVKSFNEAAVTLAEAVSGDEWSFARLMNEKAVELGMNHTSFRNSTGLHAEGQYTTSFDLARLARRIKQDFPKYYYLFSLREFSFRDVEYKTHNHVLVEYDGAEGMKTGFTKASGFNLVSSAKRGDKRLFLALMGCASYQKRDEFVKKILDEAFEKVGQSRNDENKNSDGFFALSQGFNYDKKWRQQ